MMTKNGKFSWKELNPRRQLSADSYFVADKAMITVQYSLLTAHSTEGDPVQHQITLQPFPISYLVTRESESLIIM